MVSVITVRSRFALAASLYALLALSLAGPARASIDFGSNLSHAPDAATCLVLSNPHSCTVALSALPADREAPGGVSAPADGVVVGWKVRSGPQAEPRSVRLHVLEGNSSVALGPLETLETSASTYSFAARIPVDKGDRLALDFPEVPAFVTVPVISMGGADGSSFDIWVPMLAAGATQAPTFDEAASTELLLSATLEPDVDGDGWGDETQDKCPGQDDPTNACPPPKGGPPPPPGETPLPLPTEPTTPDTKLGKGGPKGTIGKAKATFRFSATVAGSTFHCKLDKKTWKPCKSPKTYRGLKEGRHTFKVRAVGVSGLIDSTPAKRSFKVEL